MVYSAIVLNSYVIVKLGKKYPPLNFPSRQKVRQMDFGIGGGLNKNNTPHHTRVDVEYFFQCYDVVEVVEVIDGLTLRPQGRSSDRWLP